MTHRWLAIVLIAALLPCGPAFAKLYKWVDSEGQVHYSDRVPPEAASRGREEKSDRGMTVNRVEAAKTAQQLETERRAKAEREAIEKAARETKQRRVERDRILLLTFSGTQEIERSRDDRLAAVDGRIQLTHDRVEALRAQLERARKHAADAERAGRPSAQEHYARIETLRDQIAGYESFIADRRQERADIVAKFNADLVRYRELTVPKAPR